MCFRMKYRMTGPVEVAADDLHGPDTTVTAWMGPPVIFCAIPSDPGNDMVDGEKPGMSLRSSYRRLRTPCRPVLRF